MKVARMSFSHFILGYTVEDIFIVGKKLHLTKKWGLKRMENHRL